MLPANHQWRPSLQLSTASCVLLLLACAVSAQADQISKARLVIREDVSIQHRTELLEKLRSITGWAALDFSESGELRLPSYTPASGSNAARELIGSAVNGRSLIVLESVNSRADVVFCRVDLRHSLNTDLTAPPEYVVLMDFADFKHVGGDKEARAAFDIGWAVLHELDHVVNNSADNNSVETEGDCENNINRMRTELGLPVRMSYYFTFLPLKSDLDLISKFVRLPFEAHEPSTSKRRRYWLIWDATLVGGLPPSQTASLRISQR